jgi:hypothetical protein
VSIGPLFGLIFFIKKSHPLRESYHVLASEFVSVSIERGLESLMKNEDYNRFRSADHMPEWLREDTKPSRTSIAIAPQKAPMYKRHAPDFGLLTGCCSARSGGAPEVVSVMQLALFFRFPLFFFVWFGHHTETPFT